MSSAHTIDVSYLWKRNGYRTWILHLLRQFHSQHGKDYETIRFWIDEFYAGKTTTLTVDRDYIVTDGHHRLIAAIIADIETITINVCPQRTTYV